MENDNKNTLAYEPNNVLEMAIEPAPVMGRKVMQGKVNVDDEPKDGVYTMTFTPVADPIGGGGAGQDIANLYNLITNEAEQRARI
jgi:hypothetical protein